MRLKRVIVKHFGIFREARSFDLDDDLVVIYGDNFTGKTTLARAIYFALCGEVLTGGIKSPGLVSLYEQSATAGAIYIYKDAMYRLYRSTKGDIRSELFQDQQWQILEHNNSTLPILNSHQWKVGCFLQEDELGEFLTKSPATRRDLLNQLLGIEQLRVVQQAFIEARRLAKRLEKAELARQNNLRLDTVQDCAEELSGCRRKAALLEEKLRTPGDAENRQRLYREWQSRKDSVSGRLTTLTAEYEALLAGFANKEELHNTLQQIVTRVTEREQYIRAVEACTEKRVRLSAQLQRTEEILANLQGLRGQEICPTCMQPLSKDHVHHLEKMYQEQRDTLKTDLNKAEEEEREVRETLNLLDQLAGRETDLRRRAEKMDILERDIEEVRTELADLEVKLASVADASTGSEDKTGWQHELEQARAHLKQLEIQYERFQEYHRNINEINLQAARAAHHRLLSEWVADAVEQTMQTVIGMSLKRVAECVFDCLREFNLLKNSHQTLNLEKSRLMPDLDGRAFQALSGSERTILYLGMKLAISQLMPGADFIILDNPALHLDSARREQLRDYLLHLIPEKQIIILTNDSVFADLLGQGKRIDL